MLKVIINGCNGSMGRVVTEVLQKDKDVEIVCGIDSKVDLFENKYSTYKDLLMVKEEADVVIDFSRPETLEGLLEYGINSKTSLVIATTGYSEEQLKKIEEASKKIPIFFTANMSLGINLLIELVKKASLVLNDSFDIEIIEKHHNKKVDAPSGTAYMIANEINNVLDNSMVYNYGRSGKSSKREKNEIGIHAVRGGTIPGEHTVIYAGEDEILEIKHTALSKKIFAEGALKGAKFISKQSEGLYSMKDMLNI